MTGPLVWLSNPSQNAAPVQPAGGGPDDVLADGDDGAADVGAGVVGVCPLAVQVTCGAGLADPFARKPNVVLPPVGTVPFQVALTAVTAVPDWVSTEFQPWLTCCGRPSSTRPASR